MLRVIVHEKFQNEHMRDLLEEVEDQLSNSLKELNQKSQEAQRYKVHYPNITRVPALELSLAPPDVPE